jgi:hypothetical protein
MKSLILLFGIVLTISCAPTQPVTLIPLEKGVEIDVVGTKDELWVEANLHLVDVMNNPNYVIEFSDKEAGVIKGKYLIDSPINLYGMVTTGGTYATFMIKATDNHLSITITDDGAYERHKDVSVRNRIAKSINGVLSGFETHFKSDLGE